MIYQVWIKLYDARHEIPLRDISIWSTNIRYYTFQEQVEFEVRRFWKPMQALFSTLREQTFQLPKYRVWIYASGRTALAMNVALSDWIPVEHLLDSVQEVLQAALSGKVVESLPENEFDRAIRRKRRGLPDIVGSPWWHWTREKAGWWTE